MSTQRRTKRTTTKRKLSTCTAIVPTRSEAEETWHTVQRTIRKRRQRLLQCSDSGMQDVEALPAFANRALHGMPCLLGLGPGGNDGGAGGKLSLGGGALGASLS